MSDSSSRFDLPTGFEFVQPLRPGVGRQRHLGLWLALFVTGCAQPQAEELGRAAPEQVRFVYAERIGLARFEPDGGGCLSIFNGGVRSGARVALIEPRATGEPATVTVGIVGPGSATTCDERLGYASPAGTAPVLYAISGSTSASRPVGVFVAVLEPPPESAERGNRGEADLDGDGVPESFRLCASSEGLHFTVWTGTALPGRLRWHRYLYAGYDLEPSCTERDYAAISSFGP
jgi:hypothetical protein